MSDLGSVPGYAGLVWNNVLGALNYVSSNLDVSSPETSVPLVQTFTHTLINAANSLTAYSYAQAAPFANSNLDAFIALPITLPNGDEEYIVNRRNAMETATTQLNNIVSGAISFDFSVMQSGKPTIPSVDLVSYWLTFNDETPPTGLATDTLSQYVSGSLQAWEDAANVIVTTGVGNGAMLNTLNAMASVVSGAYSDIQQITPSSLINVTSLWNLLVAAPSISRIFSALANDVSSLMTQQIIVIRNAILNILQQYNQILVSYEAQTATEIQITTVNNAQTLMDMAASQLGDYEKWTDIANLNSLQPPYIGNGQNLASPGSQVLLPTQGVVASGTSIPTVVPNYSRNFLGVDMYLGPINGAMPNWTGDVLLIAGYQNYSQAIGRRLQTPLGALIYHRLYGSRIPPEIGQVQTQSTAAHIASYAEAAIMSDPRTNQVQNPSVTLGNNGAINYSATVLPKGSSATGVSVNEVLQPV